MPSSSSASSSSLPIPIPVPLNLPLKLQALNDLFPPMPPHCSKAVVTPSHPSSLSGSNAKNLRNRLNIGVGQTVCFKTDETSNPSTNASTQLHTLTLSRLEQYHSITQRYRFAIPEVETKCICECSAKTAICQAEDYSYGRCSGSNPSNTACHRTFFSDQPATGCPTGSGGEPRLCCELKFRPYENRTFTALRLEAPTTFAVLRYSAFSWENGRWNEEDKRTIRIYLDGSTQNQFLDAQKNLELSINSMGKSSNQLAPGMYFVENFGHGSYGELIQQSLNEVTDHNFERLGWFRQDSNGQFFVHNGYVMMDKIHRAKTENCMDQKFQSILDANFYINKLSNESTKFQIAESLNRTFRWIKSARVVDSEERHAIVTENEGTNLEITLTSNLIEKLLFVHNASQIQDFTATIIVDRFSNSVLNITVFNATGILNGYVKQIIDYKSEHIDSFTLYVPESTPVTRQLYARIKPYPSNTVQMVCLRPDDSPTTSEVCRPVESIQDELAKNEIDNRWSDEIGKCPECNHVSMDGLMKYLNPMSWASGVSSISDFFMLLADIVVYFSVAVAIYVIFTKCLYPIMRCCICPTMPCMPCFSKNTKK
uniref:Uncharacterized protein n=1 Tax=Panagrolaimus superbus TaxID=310955 RepID=A0A914YR33_9BILA